VVLRLHGRINSLELLVVGLGVVRLLRLRGPGVHPRPLRGLMTMRSELQVSAAAPVVVAVVAVAYPRLAGGAVRISHSYHPASATVQGV